MIETVLLRHKGSQDFDSYYESLCALESTCPVASVRAGAKTGVLSCPIYRLKRQDWHPILTALQINKALHTVAFFDRWETSFLQEKRAKEVGRIQRTLSDAKGKRRYSSADLVYNITRSVSSCLSRSSSITSLILEGLTLKVKDIKCLSKGLLKNRSLTNLSFKGSSLGDTSADLICQCVKKSSTLVTLDLSACNLSHVGASAVASLIKHQCVVRQTNLWRESLRYREPALGGVAGLRRVTLSLNVCLGDRGVACIAEALKDDVWIKAVDVQMCGVTSDGARVLLDVLRVNRSLHVLDLRDNAFVDDDLIEMIHRRLSFNLSNSPSPDKQEWVWFDVESERITREAMRRLGSVPRLLKPIPIDGRKKKKKIIAAIGVDGGGGGGGGSRKGLPWRTAARSTERWKNLQPRSIRGTVKACYNEGGTDREETSPSSPLSMTPPAISPLTSPGPVVGTGTAVHSADINNTPSDSTLCTCSCDHNIAACAKAVELKQLQIDLLVCQRKLKDEVALRARTETRLLQLDVENRRLNEEKLSRGSDSNKDATKCTSSGDESVFEAVETAFQQFHQFLDLLNEKGFGKLCSLVEMGEWPLPATTPNMQQAAGLAMTEGEAGASCGTTPCTSQALGGDIHIQSST